MRRPLTSDALQWLRQREVPSDVVREATANYSRPLQSRERGVSVLVFQLGAESLALPVAAFDEVTEPRKPHSLPMRRSGALLGVVNVRGELLACVSLAVLLGVDAPDTSEGLGARLLVLNQARRRHVACPVHAVHGVWSYEPKDLAAPPSNLNPAAVRHTNALLTREDRTVGLLDHEALLQAVERSLA